MEHAQNFHAAIAHTIRNDVGSVGNNQFSGTDHPAGAAHCRVALKILYGMADRGDHSIRSGRIIARNILRFGIEIGQGLAQPFNAHYASISSSYVRHSCPTRSRHD